MAKKDKFTPRENAMQAYYDHRVERLKFEKRELRRVLNDSMQVLTNLEQAASPIRKAISACVPLLKAMPAVPRPLMDLLTHLQDFFDQLLAVIEATRAADKQKSDKP